MVAAKGQSDSVEFTQTRRAPMKFFGDALVILLAATCASSSFAREENVTNTIPIGVASVEITPETPLRMYGYASRKTESEGIAGRLFAKALAIGDDASKKTSVLLAVDCGAVPSSIYEQVFERVQAVTPIERERFVLCNSHCHSGPNLKGMAAMEGEERVHLEQYAQLLQDRLVFVVTEALNRRQPSSLSIARGSVSIAANRRVLTDGKWTGFGAVPDAPVDHEVSVLKVTNLSGRVRTLIINYACHNTTLRGDFKQIHGDWAGSAQRLIEAGMPGVTAMITIGCGADSDPCPHGTVELCDQHGTALAAEIKRLMASDWRPIRPEIVAKQTVLTIPWHDCVEEELEADEAGGSWAVQRLLEYKKEHGRLPDAPTFQITTWMLGDDLAMVFLSDELVVDYVLRLKQEFDAHRLWVTAYTNDVTRYVASPRVIAEGGYEARNSLSASVTLGQPELLDPPMMERIVAAVRELLPSDFAAQ
jgi:hypothetical protein